MYGFVRPAKSDLKIKEFVRYRGVYCCLCHSLAEYYGFLPRFTVNYDLTFLLLLLRSFDKDEKNLEARRCSKYLGKNKLTAAVDEDSKFCAALSIFLANSKFEDNLLDKEKVFLSKTARGAFFYSYQKAKNDYPEIEKKIKKYLPATLLAEQNDEKRCLELWQNEWRKVQSFFLDETVSCDNLLMKIAEQDLNRTLFPEAAVVFSDLMEDLFVYAAEIKSLDEATKRAMFFVARYLARWIYLIDALADFDDDKEQGKHNPFKGFANFTEAKSFVNDILLFAEAEIDFYLSRMNFCQDAEIFQNIAQLGLPETRSCILQKKSLAKL